MRVRHSWQQGLGLIVVGLVLAGLASAAQSASAIHYVEGRGAILREDQAAARQRALRGSLRQAVERSVGDVVDAQIRLANIKILKEKIYQRASHYIRSYRVVWEYPDLAQKVYRIRVEAQVALEDLTAEIDQLGLNASGRAAVRLLVLIREDEQMEPRFAGQAPRVLGRQLQTHFEADRFRLVQPAAEAPWDGQEASALAVGRAAQADIVLVVSAAMQKTHDGVAGTALKTVQVTAQMRVWVPVTGIQLAIKRAEVSVDHADTFLAGQQALEKTAMDLSTQLGPDLETYRQRRGGGANGAPRRF